VVDSSTTSRARGADGTINVLRRGPAAVVEISNPSRLNALSWPMATSLDEKIRDLGLDEECRAIVLCGAGSSFCSGFDLASEDLGTDTAHKATLRQDAFNKIVLAVREVSVPVIAVVSGKAAGGGMALALAADIRIVERDAQFIPSFVRLGLTGEMGITYLLPRIVGWDRAAEILLTGRAIDATEAARIGMATEVVETGTGMIAASELIGSIARLTAGSTRQTKTLLNMSLDAHSLRHQIDHEGRTQLYLSQSSEFKDAVASFVTRRPAAD
jgi:enoyl-CoA hydratase